MQLYIDKTNVYNEKGELVYKLKIDFTTIVIKDKNDNELLTVKTKWRSSKFSFNDKYRFLKNTSSFFKSQLKTLNEDIVINRYTWNFKTNILKNGNVIAKIILKKFKKFDMKFYMLIDIYDDSEEMFALYISQLTRVADIKTGLFTAFIIITYNIIIMLLRKFIWHY